MNTVNILYDQFITPYSQEAEAKLKTVGWSDNGGILVKDMSRLMGGRIVLIFEPTRQAYRALRYDTLMSALFIPAECLSESLIIGATSVDALHIYASAFGLYNVHAHFSHL